MDLLGVLIGAILAWTGVLIGVAIHMRYLDRRFMPPLPKPQPAQPKPTRTPTQPLDANGGQQI